MKNNYSSLSVPYYQARIEAMSRHIKGLEERIEFLEAQLEIKDKELKDNL